VLSIVVGVFVHVIREKWNVNYFLQILLADILWPLVGRRCVICQGKTLNIETTETTKLAEEGHVTTPAERAAVIPDWMLLFATIAKKII
jgi:hypothetical protein